MLRFYVYISDSKVDMLYGQIPPGLLSRIGAELKIDLKVLSVSIRERPNDETRFGRLRVVENYLRRNETIGSVSEPAAWFEDRMIMRSSIYRSAPGGLLYFSGQRDGTVVALIGSGRHLVGQQPQPPEMHLPFSHLPYLLSYLRDEIPQTGQETQDDERWALSEIAHFSRAVTGVRQPSVFLARRLLTGEITFEDGETVQAVVGTPLYVALDDSD